MSEFDSHWVPHSYSLVPHMNKLLSKLLQLRGCDDLPCFFIYSGAIQYYFANSLGWVVSKIALPLKWCPWHHSMDFSMSLLDEGEVDAAWSYKFHLVCIWEDLIPPCLTLSIIRYVSRVKWSNPGKGVASSPTPRYTSYWKWEPPGHPRLQSTIKY